MPVLGSWLCSPPPCPLLTLLVGLIGVAVQGKLQVTQPEESVTTAGEAATLHCHVTSGPAKLSVRWFRKTEQGPQLIYDFQRGDFPRVTSASDVTKKDNTDFSILIRDITVADAGSYTCMAFPDFYLTPKFGTGTLLTVRTKPSPPEVSGPKTRATPGHTVTFTCKSHGFSLRDISLQWFKNGNVLSDTRTSVDPQGDSVSYNISSTARVPLVPGDVRSQVICEVTHSTLNGGSLRGTVNLSETIRVPPTLEVSQLFAVGNQVNIICQVKKFYPRKLQLTWLENGTVSRTETTSLLLENKDGTFNRTSWLLVNSSVHRENVAFTCRVEHDGQPALSKSHTLEVSAPQKDQGTNEQIDSRSSAAFLIPLLSLLIASKMIIAISAFAMYLIRK